MSFNKTFSFLNSSKHYKVPPPKHKPDVQKSHNSLQRISVHAVLVNKRQRANPVLKHISNIPWKIAPDLVPDFEFGSGACGLFISLRYFLLHPEYLFGRVQELKRTSHLRVILCLVDLEDNETPILEVTKIAMFHSCTLILAWSAKEVARYIETFKAYENKSAETIQEKTSTDFLEKLTECLRQIRSVNKTDVLHLASIFGCLGELMGASMEELMLCPGIGRLKAKRIHDTFHSPF